MYLLILIKIDGFNQIHGNALRRLPISIPLSELEVAAKCCSQHV